MMRHRHPLLFWLGLFWLLRHFARRGRYGGFGRPYYGHHGHHRHYRPFDYV